VRDEVYLNKPPLYFWVVAVFALPFGAATDATAPIASVLSALMGLLGVFAIGRRLWDDDTGLAAAVVLATSPFYFFMAHQVLTDMMLTAWMTWALYFYLASLDEAGRRGALVGFYLCAAGGLAAKGPAALMVLVAAIAASLATDGVRGLKRLRLPMGLAILALTALPWLLPYLLQREKSYGRAVVMTDYLGWYFRSAVGSRLQAIAGHLFTTRQWTLGSANGAALDEGVGAGGVERAVEGEVGLDHRRHLAAAAGAPAFAQQARRQRGTALGGEPRCQRIEGAAHLVGVDDGLGVERCHAQAAARRVFDEAVFLQQAQRLQHGLARNRQPRCQFFLRDAFARREGAAADGDLQRAVRLIDEIGCGLQSVEGGGHGSTVLCIQ